jgi:prevent-host-death family protein
MKAVTAREANQSFSRFLGEAERGAEIVITKRGRPVAKLVPVQPTDGDDARRAAAERAIELMKKGLDLGGRRFTRDEIYEDRIPKRWRDMPDAPPGDSEGA